ncbi:hypothetical protein AVEN_98453-1 [Araneus ventricosus]|uniref:Uncharacterized protein n=1 Tax=Araneus ventricosus TaxID=182803 RepID=A0A4Y2UF24_ARAVE|nr:hypothetical protein AVEN_98453-1 [Araneus ventricosus]
MALLYDLEYIVQDRLDLSGSGVNWKPPAPSLDHSQSKLPLTSGSGMATTYDLEYIRSKTGWIFQWKGCVSKLRPQAQTMHSPNFRLHHGRRRDIGTAWNLEDSRRFRAFLGPQPQLQICEREDLRTNQLGSHTPGLSYDPKSRNRGMIGLTIQYANEPDHHGLSNAVKSLHQCRSLRIHYSSLD